MGLCELLDNNYSQGSKDYDDAKIEIEKAIQAKNLKIDSQFKPIISKGLMKYSEYLVGQGELQHSSDVLSLGQQILPNDGFLKTQHNMIIKQIEKQTQDTLSTQ